MAHKWTKVSYIGRPTDDSIMYITSKIANKLPVLQNVKGCLVFAQEGMDIPQPLQERHTFEMVENPAGAYTAYVTEIAKAKNEALSRQTWTHLDNGVMLGEGVTLGCGVILEPGVVVGAGVQIGDYTHVKAHSSIFNATIGSHVTIDVGAVIGVAGFTAALGEDNNLQMIPTLGEVVIEDHVYIGAKTTIAAGTAGNTIIEHHAKIASQVVIEHDCLIHENVELCAGGVLGGFVEIGAWSFVGLNTSIRNRKIVGQRVMIGMGSVVLNNIEDNARVWGSPARPH